MLATIWNLNRDLGIIARTYCAQYCTLVPLQIFRSADAIGLRVPAGTDAFCYGRAHEKVRNGAQNAIVLLKDRVG